MRNSWQDRWGVKLAITIDQVTQALDGASLKYHRVDDTHVLLGFRGQNVTLHVVLSLQEDGEYVELRTVQWASCPADHPHFDQVVDELTRQNLRLRLLKFGWDRDDGEITAEACIPLEDNRSLPTSQLQGLVMGVFALCDEVMPNIERHLQKRRGPKRPASSSTPSRPSPGSTRSSSPGNSPAKSNMPYVILCLGVLLFGAAALLGVIYLFMR